MRTKACDVVEAYLDAFLKSRWDEVRPALADGCEVVDPLMPEPVKGKQAVMDLLAYCHSWGHYHGEILNLFGDEHQVAAQLWISGKVIEAPEGMPDEVVGREFAFAECDVFQLDDHHRITKVSIYADVVTLQNQLGQEF